MTTEEYEKHIQEIDDTAHRLRAEVHKNFALSHAKAKVGDVVVDHRSCIRVEEVDVVFAGYNKYPQCRYSGPRLTAKDLPYKNGQRDIIFDCNVESVREGKWK